jgi:hypothetical protein
MVMRPRPAPDAGSRWWHVEANLASFGGVVATLPAVRFDQLSNAPIRQGQIDLRSRRVRDVLRHRHKPVGQIR